MLFALGSLGISVLSLCFCHWLYCREAEELVSSLPVGRDPAASYRLGLRLGIGQTEHSTKTQRQAEIHQRQEEVVHS